MKLDKMIGDRFKERPSDCAIAEPCADGARRIYEERGKWYLFPVSTIEKNYGKD